MSFDLWFASKEIETVPNIRDVQEWFMNRTNYDPENINDSQAMYENKDTGVYFIVEFGSVFDPADAPDTKRSVFAVVLLNYLRPKFFAVECALEIQQFANRFGLEVCDPQESEDDFVAFDDKKFVASFSKHSRWAVKSMGENHGFTPKLMPSEKLEVLWRWNFQKKDREAETNEDVFFPTMFVFEAGGNFSTGVVWPDGIPTVIPPCDSIYIHWDELAQKSVLGLRLGPKKSGRLYEMRALNRIFSEFYHAIDDSGCLWPREFVRPANLARVLRNFDQPGVSPAMLAAGAVIDDDYTIE